MIRMPAEWELHECTWLSWPHNRDTWPKILPDAQMEFIEFVFAIAASETVKVVVPNERELETAQCHLAKRGTKFSIDFQIIPTNDAWIRDYGPTFVHHDQGLAAIDWRYNAWGGKYPPFDHDQSFVFHLCERLQVRRIQSELCFEGGAIEVDGNGLAMCTRSCAMDPNRNPKWAIEQIENELRQCLGLNQLIWLSGDAIAGDDTDGHIDQLARFLPGGNIVYAMTSDSSDPQTERLMRNLSDLKKSVDENCRELIELPLPCPVFLYDIQLPASYCNFYTTNRSVIVPQFDKPESDQRAIDLLSNCFDDREVIGLPSLHLVWGLGSFHCLTQQQPALPTQGE